MSNPLIKHYLIALLIGAVTWLATHLIPAMPSDVAASLSLVVTWFTHHYLENATVALPAQTPSLGGGSGSDPSPPIIPAPTPSLT